MFCKKKSLDNNIDDIMYPIIALQTSLFNSDDVSSKNILIQNAMKIIVKYFYSSGVINLQLSNFVVNNFTHSLL